MTSLTEHTSHPRARRYGARTCVASLAACLTVVLGGSVANAATVDSTAAQATATIAVNAGPLDRVDWASVVEPCSELPQNRGRAPLGTSCTPA